MSFSCSNPESLEAVYWVVCYLTNGKHLAFYWSIVNVLILLIFAAPSALILGLSVATAADNAMMRVRGENILELLLGLDLNFFLNFFLDWI